MRERTPTCFVWTKNDRPRVMIVDQTTLNATAEPQTTTGLVAALQQAQKYGCTIETLHDADYGFRYALDSLFDELAAERQARARGDRA